MHENQMFTSIYQRKRLTRVPGNDVRQYIQTESKIKTQEERKIKTVQTCSGFDTNASPIARD
jgi:hypothetical protein